MRKTLQIIMVIAGLHGLLSASEKQISEISHQITEQLKIGSSLSSLKNSDNNFSDQRINISSAIQKKFEMFTDSQEKSEDYNQLIHDAIRKNYHQDENREIKDTQKESKSFVGENISDTLQNILMNLNLSCENKLLDVHAPMNENGSTLLMLASKNKSPQALAMVCFLVEQGADIHAQNNKGFTPLHFAVLNKGNDVLKIVQFLVEQGADIHARNYFGVTPLKFTCAEQGLAIVQFLVDQGADIHATNKADSTALHSAVINKGNDALKIVQFLVDQGADIHANLKSGYHGSGKTPLGAACSNNGSQALEIIQFLVAQGANIHVSDDLRSNPLIIACQYNECPQALQVIQFLVSKGANVNTFNIDGKTPLMFACKNKSSDALAMVQFLIESGADIHACDNDGETPLMFACKNEGEQGSVIANFLMDTYANLNFQNKHDETAEQVASIIEMTLISAQDLSESR